MDYERMAKDYMETMFRMRKRGPQKQISDSMHGENVILDIISHHEGFTPSDISNEMGITTARVAAVLNSLETKGMITRQIDTEDRRRIVIELTEAGKKQVQNHYERIMGTVINMLRYLGEEDSMELIRIMGRLAQKEPDDFL